MLIDTHAHLDFREYDQDRDEVINRAFKNGVAKIINIGCNLERGEKAILIAERYRNVYATVGVHPHDIENLRLCYVGGNLAWLARNKKVVAIGECGLDYYRLRGSKDRQIDFFREQLRVASSLNLPVVLHCRDAYQDMLQVLAEEKKRYPLCGVTHCFSGNYDKAKQFVELGFYLSFTGAITFAKKEDVLEAVKKISLDKIMVETDSPYLAPEPNRGKRNEPAFVKYVAEKIAEVKGIGLEDVASKTTANAVKLFKLK